MQEHCSWNGGKQNINCNCQGVHICWWSGVNLRGVHVEVVYVDVWLYLHSTSFYQCKLKLQIDISHNQYLFNLNAFYLKDQALCKIVNKNQSFMSSASVRYNTKPGTMSGITFVLWMSPVPVWQVKIQNVNKFLILKTFCASKHFMHIQYTKIYSAYI